MAAENQQNEFDLMVKKMVEEDDHDGEKTLLPFIFLIFTVLLFIISIFIWFSGNPTFLHYEQVEGLAYMKFKYWLLAFIIYCIPIAFVSTTRYQRKKKRVVTNFMVFGFLSSLALFFIISTYVEKYNITKDNSKPKVERVEITDRYYLTGSRSSTGNFYINLYINSLQKEVSIKHNSRELQKTILNKDSVSVLIYNGYYNKKWVVLVEP